MDERKISWLTLALIPELGPRSLWKLYNKLGGPEAILVASESEILAKATVRQKTARAIAKKQTIRNPLEEWDRLSRRGINFITWDDENYPALLRHISDPPLFLFSKGTYRPEHAAAIAIVGTRNASVRGLIFAETLAADLARCGVTVVSGLAVGIDSAAHRGALKVGGETIAVMGSGLDVPYPRTNRDMLDRIAESGVVFSEYPLGTPPEKWRFPLRNRIVSGLSAGVVVVEAGLRSGALITARLALEQGREVFAVPGPVTDERSSGVNRLLKEGAKLVENAKDILDECASWFKELSKISLGRANKMISPSYSPMDSNRQPTGSEEARILQCLSGEPQHVDRICEKTGLSCSTVLSFLTIMELKGLVQQLPGKYFVRKG
ncbi:MAG: DNA-processing protein DprA [Syntrophobacterales bacterium]|nr:DNA-processing protein DprA [Syntrophobacterales bacterium]